MLDNSPAFDDEPHERYGRVAHPAGIIAIGFLLMLAGFPVFFAMARAELSVPWFAIGISMMLEVAGLGLVALTSWSRCVGMLMTSLVSIFMSIRLVIAFVRHFAQSPSALATYGPLMAVLGLIVSALLIMLPSFLIVGYLGSCRVKATFWELQHNNGEALQPIKFPKTLKDLESEGPEVWRQDAPIPSRIADWH